MQSRYATVDIIRKTQVAAATVQMSVILTFRAPFQPDVVISVFWRKAPKYFILEHRALFRILDKSPGT